MLHGSLDNLILLTLMVVLFGLLLRGRRRLYKRYWLVGWVLTLCSYALWAATDITPALTVVANRSRYELGLAGAVTFLISFLIRYAPLRRILLMALALTAVVCTVNQFADFFALHLDLLRGVLVATLIATLLVGHVLLPKAWTARRIVLLLVALFTTATGFRSTFYGTGTDPVIFLCDLTRGGVLFASAVLFVGEFGLTLSSISVLVGFATWAATYYFSVWGAVYHREFAQFHELYNLPKYFVGVGMIVKIFEDTRARVEQQAEQYRELYEQFRLLFDAYPNPMWIAEPATGRFLTSNPAATANYGFAKSEFLTMKLTDLEFAERRKDNLPLILDPLLALKNSEPVRHRRKDGTKLWAELVDSSIPFLGKPARFLIARDITEEVRVNQDLLHKAHHDALTGLPNRSLLEQRLKQRLADSARDGRKMLVLMLDIDYFKQINDTHGHIVGDECLALVAQRLRSSLREADTIGRTGGEEFMAVIGGLHTVEEARIVTTSLLNLFHEPFVVASGEVLTLKISIGAAVFPDDATEIEALRQQSDQALYRAKRNGRNRAEFADALQASTNP